MREGAGSSCGARRRTRGSDDLVAPPLPTVAPTRVPTVHSLTHSLAGARRPDAGVHDAGTDDIDEGFEEGFEELPPLVLSGHAASLTPY